jgi:L-amino acid N-acyltransferase YncA
MPMPESTSSCAAAATRLRAVTDSVVMTDHLVRDLETDDLEEITSIYNDVMATSFAIWRETPTSLAERQDWFDDASANGHPMLVAADRSGVLGFIAAEPFRPWPGYAATWEHSIHVRSDARSRGIGRGLLDAMEPTLRARGAHVMVAGIDAENTGSLRFHTRAGFVLTGRMPEVGQLKASWRDLVFVQKILSAPAPPLTAADVSSQVSTVAFSVRTTGPGG